MTRLPSGGEPKAKRRKTTHGGSAGAADSFGWASGLALGAESKGSSGSGGGGGGGSDEAPLFAMAASAEGLAALLAAPAPSSAGSKDLAAPKQPYVPGQSSCIKSPRVM